MRDMAHSICLIKLYQTTRRKDFNFLFLTTLTHLLEDAHSFASWPLAVIEEMRVHIWARASPVPHPEMSPCSCSLTGYFEGELLNDRVKFFNECRRSLLTNLGPILLGVQNLLNSKKGRLWSLRQPATKRMRILKTGEPEMKALFIS